jgi:hypothetical protein
MRSVVTFVNCIYAIEITQFWRPGTTDILIFARWPVNHGCGPSPKKVGHTCPNKKEMKDEGCTFHSRVWDESQVNHVSLCLSVCLKVGIHNIKCNINLYGFHAPYVDWTSYWSPFGGFYFVVVAIFQCLTGTPFPIMETCFIKLQIPYIRLKKLMHIIPTDFF